MSKVQFIDYIQELKDNYNQLNRIHEQIIKYNNTVDTMNKENYLNNHSTFLSNLRQVNEFKSETKRLLKDARKDLSKKQQTEDISNKLKQKFEGIDPIIKTIMNKEVAVCSRLGITNPLNEDSEEFNNEALQQESMQDQFKIHEVVDEKKRLEKRREDLIECNKISKEIKANTELMKSEVKIQGEALNKTETKIDETVENTRKAELEIYQAQVLEEGNNKKKIWIIVILVVVVIGIALGVTLGVVL